MKGQYVHEKTSVSLIISSVQSLNCVWLFATPWIAECQASLSITNCQSSVRFTSVESLIIREMQIKTTMKYCLMPIRVANIKKIKDIYTVENTEKMKTLCAIGGNRYTTMEVSQNIKNRATIYDQQFHFWEHIHRKWKHYAEKISALQKNEYWKCNKKHDDYS